MRRWLLLLALVAVVVAAYLVYEHMLADEGAGEAMDVEDVSRTRKRRPPRWKKPRVRGAAASEREGDAAPPADENLDAFQVADRYLEESAAWIAGATPVAARVETMRLVVDGTLHDRTTGDAEGRLVVHLGLPDRIRLDWTENGATRSRLRTADGYWAIAEDGTSTDLREASNPDEQTAELDHVLARYRHLASAIVVAPWREGAARTRFEGTVSRRTPQGGDWLKITHEARGGAVLQIWVAHQEDAEGVTRARSPGILRVPGTPAIEWHLADWSDGGGQSRRGPTVLSAYEVDPDAREGDNGTRLLHGKVVEVHVNQRVDDRLFDPPR